MPEISATIRVPCGTKFLDERWLKTKWFCPACGKAEVWEEVGAGDYYVGSAFLCSACGAAFYLPQEPEPSGAEDDDVRLARLRQQALPG